MGLRSWIRCWGSTPEERAAGYPCDTYRAESARPYWRAITVRADAALTYRWLCQVRVAPYSYDRIDNHGRHSPRELTPGADRIEIGDQLMVFRVRDVEPGHQISGVVLPEVEGVFGPMALTYRVVPLAADRSRMVVKLWMGRSGRLGGLKRAMLAFGDVFMMRKQLTTLRDLAERDARRKTQAVAR